ncbi:unnamed protein product [Camellia sinensis]
MKRPSQKYIEIVTVDNFDFWFMGFLNYRGTFKYPQQTLSQARYLQLDQNELCKSSVQKSPKSLLCNPDSQYHIPPPPNGSLKFKKSTVIDKMNKLGEKVDHLVNAFKITRLESNISETVKGKLRLGVVGVMERIFKQNFNITEGEKLRKACQCYLSTTLGPMQASFLSQPTKLPFALRDPSNCLHRMGRQLESITKS